MNRIDRIKKRIHEVEFYTKKEWWGQDETILTDENVLNETVMVRKALAIAYTLRNMPVTIKPDELIVGITTMSSVGFGREIPTYTTPEEDAEALKSSFTYKSTWGHPVDYKFLLEKGVTGIKQDIYERIEKEMSLENPEFKKLDFFRAMIISLDALIDLADRYANLAMKCAFEEPDADRRKELMEISRVCSRVPRYPAETLQEALQSFWFIFISNQGTMEHTPTGRSDQYLYPYYKKDIEEGVITEDEADELIFSWLAKFSERIEMRKDDWEDHTDERDGLYGGDPESFDTSNMLDNSSDYNYGSAANHWQTNMMLGGQTPDGKDATNELTYKILKLWSHLDSIAPVLSVRFHKNSSKELYDLCSEVLRKGTGGVPALYNDEVVIPGLLKMGIPEEDARDYSNDGCWEVLIPGKSDYTAGNLELLQILEYAMQHGRSLVRDRVEADDIGDLEQFKTFDEFYNAVLVLIEKQINADVDGKLRYWRDRVKIAPSPLISAMIHDCLERGLDKTDAGARYTFFADLLTGVSNFVDSLMTIKQMVFEEKQLTLTELAELCRTNFEGNESMRQKIITRVPKIGNDQNEVDELLIRCLDDCYDIMTKINQENDTGDLILVCGIGTFESYVMFGHNVGASADGRLSQESVSSNFSPSFGCDKNGPTAAIKTMTKPDLMKYITGCPLDMQFNNNEVAGEEGILRMSGMIKSFFDMGGMILTLAGTNSEQLIAAQKEPEKYSNLRVRMGGYSAYFTLLSPEMQQTMIDRSKHQI